MRRAVWAFVLSLMLLGLFGCGQEKAETVTSLSFGKEGEVLHRIVGKTDQSYYQIQAADLEAFAAERVAEYCAQKGEGRVALEKVEEKDGQVFLDFRYASPEDYSAFNSRALYVGGILGAAEAGYSLEAVSFVTAAGEAAESDVMEKPEKKRLVVLETKGGEEMLVNLPGKVYYVNQIAAGDGEVAFAGKKSVKVTNQGDEGAFALAYIIYE